MDIRFQRDQLNTKFLQGGMGDAFQRFVYDVLSHDYPNLHLYPAGGKDGGIDLSAQSGESSVFIECKYIAQDGLAEARSRWHEVSVNLERNLSTPSRPPVGQDQYSPWYDTKFPVVEYLFCISSRLANPNQTNKFREDIESFFLKLSANNAHLKHLASISVRLLDLEDLSVYLARYPQVTFRWFPRTRPIGLIPLDDVPETGNFRSYLYSDTLPYYSRSAHLQVVPAPADLVVSNEETLLSELESADLAGLIITGKGGVGKTRLTLEIGRLAKRTGWTVLRSHRNLSAETIIQLTETVNTDNKVLIIADYIEVQREFNEFVDTLVALNETYDLRIKYVANCRTSFYRSIAHLPNHRPVNLSPSSQGSENAWNENYQSGVIRHILKNCGLEITDELLYVCRDRPVFAVFISYLRRNNRNDELDELLGERDFGSWVSKRLHFSFGENATSRSLALLMVLFPIPDSAFYHSELRSLAPILKRLAADGWLGQNSEDNRNESRIWFVAHDVLADQIVVSYLESIPGTVSIFIQDSLTLAAKVGGFKSALVTLQRISDQNPLQNIDWFSIFRRHISEEPAWSPQHECAALVRTSLLTPLERIRLLHGNEEFWDGAETDLDFQNAIGWLTRWAEREGSDLLNDDDYGILSNWIGKISPNSCKSNYALTAGLRLFPEVARDAAFKWISTRPYEIETHYLIVAWLEAGLPSEEIELSVWLWTSHFMFHRQLSFVASSWLAAKGDPELIHYNISAWLEKFGILPEASFLYNAWLSADGEPEFTQKQIEEWFKYNGEGYPAFRIYISWLKNHPPSDTMIYYVEKWLDIYVENRVAGSLYKAWLFGGNDKEFIRGYLTRWLSHWETDSWTSSIFSSWLRSGGEWEYISPSIKAWLLANKDKLDAAYVFNLWVSYGGETDWIKPHLTDLILKYGKEPDILRALTAWLRAYGPGEFITNSIVDWLEVHFYLPRTSILFKSWITANGEFSKISDKVAAWLDVNSDSDEVDIFARFIFSDKYSVPEADRLLLRFFISRSDDEKCLRRLTTYMTKPLRSFDYDDISLAAVSVLERLLSPDAVFSQKQHRSINTLLIKLLNSSRFSAGEGRVQGNELLARWIENRPMAKLSLKPYREMYFIDFFQRLGELLAIKRISVDQNYDALVNIFSWVDKWPVEKKAESKNYLEYLSNSYPAQKLWSKIKFNSNDSSPLDLESVKTDSAE